MTTKRPGKHRIISTISPYLQKSESSANKIEGDHGPNLQFCQHPRKLIAGHCSKRVHHGAKKDSLVASTSNDTFLKGYKAKVSLDNQTA